MKTRNKPAIKRNSPQSADDDFTPEEIEEMRRKVAIRRRELFPMGAWTNPKNSAHHRGGLTE